MYLATKPPLRSISVAQHLMIRADDPAHVLGIEPRRHRGRADEVAEHHGQLAALGGVRLGRIRCYRSFRRRLCREHGDVGGVDNPRRFRTRLPSLDVAALDHAQRGHLVHANDFRRGIERDLATFCPFAVPVDRDFVVAAEAAHALLGPAIAVTSRLATTIEQPCDLAVWHQSGEFAD
jgi:hypothetical protein